jgi:hypothetical protein
VNIRRLEERALAMICRNFHKLATVAAVNPKRMLTRNLTNGIDMRNRSVVLRFSLTAREMKAARMLVEEAEKCCGIRWPINRNETDNAGVTAPVTNEIDVVACRTMRNPGHGNAMNFVCASCRHNAHLKYILDLV